MPTRTQPRHEFWRRLAREASRQVRTPFYLFSAVPYGEALQRLRTLHSALNRPIRHWLSVKTQPLPDLLRWWHQGHGDVEVVSEFELLAALKTGFPGGRILANGPAKHHWLSRHPLERLNVNLDSEAELDALLPLARRCHWRLGLRLLTRAEFNPETPAHPTQFGLDPDAATRVLRRLGRLHISPEIAHFHLRTNVPSAQAYAQALQEIADFSRANRWTPRFLDCGGGLPPPGTRSLDGQRLDASFSLPELGQALRDTLQQLPAVQEVWLENGRHLSAGAGALVVSVLDVKERRGLRQLLCDGGRTLHALVSSWEDHDLFGLPARRGPAVNTAVHGPTCMAYDRLACRPLPAGIRPGDLLVWLDAGAYHLSWETRFSHGHAAVVWHNGTTLTLARQPQSFDSWWQPWATKPLAP